MTNTRVVAAAVAGLALAAGTAVGQWTVTVLYTDPARDGVAAAVWGGQQSGHAELGMGQEPHAVVWSGSAGSRVDLNPMGWTASYCLGASSGRQVGFVSRENTQHAAMWFGSASSWVDLHPSGAGSSRVQASVGGRQAGTAGLHAGIWEGTAASWRDLNPAGSRDSEGLGFDGEQVVGWFEVQWDRHACVWDLASATWADLSPGAGSQSMANCVWGGEQAGQVLDGVHWHACLWKGSAASMVDLNPAGKWASQVNAAYGGMQAGLAADSSDYHSWHAGVWRGTAGSWEDLHSYLPAGYSTSNALGMWSEGRTTWVAGLAMPAGSERWEAILWTRVETGILADFNGDGFLDFFDYDAFVACFEGAGCPEGRTADFNGDGFVDFADYGEFVAAFESGV